jgi:hypothetical protein
MWLALTLITLSIGPSMQFFGLEEVEVTFKNSYGMQSYFEAVITIIPHTENIVLWYCKYDD